MTSLPFNRGKTLRWTWTLLLVAGAVWYGRQYRPAAQTLAARDAILVEREARVRQARAAVVVLGPAGIDSALAQFRSDSALLALRVPADSAAQALSIEVKSALGAHEGAVRIVRTDPIPRSVEGGFSVAGYAVTAIGRYGAIRGLLGDLAAHPRLLRVRRLHLAAMPDSLLAAVHAPAGAPELPADSVISTALSAGSAEPFEAVATFQVVWYTRPTAASAAAGPAALTSTALLP